MVSNAEFGRRVDCSPSMASRLFAGHRRPSADLRDEIARQFEFDKDLETLKAFTEAARTKASFGRFLRVKLDRLTSEEMAEAELVPA